MHAAKAQAQFLCSGGFVSRGEAYSSSDDHDQFSFVSKWREPHEHIPRGRMLFLPLLYRHKPSKGYAHTPLHVNPPAMHGGGILRHETAQRARRLGRPVDELDGPSLT